jgi:hypothetical protein
MGKNYPNVVVLIDRVHISNEWLKELALVNCFLKIEIKKGTVYKEGSFFIKKKEHSVIRVFLW